MYKQLRQIPLSQPISIVLIIKQGVHIHVGDAILAHKMVFTLGILMI